MSRHAFYFVVDRGYFPLCETISQELLRLFDADIHIFVEDTTLTELPKVHLTDLRVHHHLNRLTPCAPSDLPTDAKWPVVVYLRIFAPQFLLDYDRVVYLDADIMPMRADPFLWEAPLPGGVGCVQDYAALDNAPTAKRGADSLSPTEKKKRWLRSIGVEQFEYFNSGVLILTPKLWVQTDWARELSNYVAKYKDTIAMFDQDFLNCYLQGKWTDFSPRYNFQYSIMNFGLEKDLVPIFAHFSTGDKPWFGRHAANIRDLDKVACDFFTKGLSDLGYEASAFRRPQRRDLFSRLKIRFRRRLSEMGMMPRKERKLRRQWAENTRVMVDYLNRARREGRFADNIPEVSVERSSTCLRFDGKTLRSDIAA
ncbi:glycosyltransferase [Sedimentitalea sp. JM2-8]|uniref:Glycosyltransferase n=1 Tax=Sedimentitalea xiamensis TaxID=3050037 RepID=A0ABT7FIP5_9RHOB|nr:glycosyltransferase [Sedimentitalea xiamensis]MDK3074953.1 glycosyltransferase [Sedimentitalea xiamensis]